MTRKTRTSRRLTLAAIAASYAASAAVYPKVPDPYLTTDPHWALPYGRLFVAFLLPTAAALAIGLISAVSRRDPLRERSPDFYATFHAVILRIVLLILGLHAVVLASLVTRRNLVTQSVPILAGLAVAAIGNLLPRLRPNVAFGFRAPWTLASRDIWMRTHRLAGYMAVMSGVVIIVAGLVLPRPAAGAVILATGLTSAVALACYSRRSYRSADISKAKAPVRSSSSEYKL